MKLKLALKLQLAQIGLALIVASVLICNNLIATANDADQQEHESPNFYFFMRPRLGNFQRAKGYLKIYQDYFTNVIQVNDKALESLDSNDWRFVRPTGEMCLKFLGGFQIKSYRLNKPYDIIPLDACLNWLFDTKANGKDPSSEKELDLKRLNARSRKDANDLLKDNKFKQIYDSTLFKNDQLPEELKDNLHDYLTRLLGINAKAPKFGCHGLWLEAYNDFIEDVYLGDCESEEDCLYFNGLKDSEKDSYLEMIVDSTKQASKNCYQVMQKQMSGLMEESYNDDAVSKLLTKRLKGSRLAAQSEALKWSEDMVKIMQLVSGLNNEQPIDLAQVGKDLKKLKNGDDETVDKFTEAIGDYAIQNFNSKETENDHDGQERFGKAMKKLCNNYWEDVDGEKDPFEFYTTIYSLIRLTNHEHIFNITKDKFEEDIMKFKWESLYFTTFACQIIATTWAELDYDSNQAAFQVSLSPTKKFLYEDWPVEILSSKLISTSQTFQASNGATGSSGHNSDSVDELQMRSSPLKSFDIGKKLKKFGFGASSTEETVDGTIETQSNKAKASKSKFSLKIFGRNSAKNKYKPNEFLERAAQAPKPTSDSPAGKQAPREPAQVQVIPPETQMKPTESSAADRHLKPTKESWDETTKMFKRLHGHYPNNLPTDLRNDYKPNEEAPISRSDYSTNSRFNQRSQVNYQGLSSKSSGAQAESPAMSSSIFDFGQSAFSSSKQQQQQMGSSASPWSDLTAISL